MKEPISMQVLKIIETLPEIEVKTVKQVRALCLKKQIRPSKWADTYGAVRNIVLSFKDSELEAIPSRVREFLEPIEKFNPKSYIAVLQINEILNNVYEEFIYDENTAEF